MGTDNKGGDEPSSLKDKTKTLLRQENCGLSDKEEEGQKYGFAPITTERRQATLEKTRSNLWGKHLE